MAELAKAYVQLVPTTKGITGYIGHELEPEAEKAGKSSGKGFAKNLAATAAKAIGALGIGKMISSSLKFGGELEQSIGGIETLFKNSTGMMLDYADEAFKTAGLSANDYMEQVTSFAARLIQATGGNTKEAGEAANQAVIDMADNANKLGTDLIDIQNAYQGFAKDNYTMLDNLKIGYGGTKSEMERLLKDAQEITGIKYDINNLSDVYEAIHVIQKELGITGTTAKESTDTLEGSTKMFKKSFSDLLGDLSSGRDISQDMLNVGESFGHMLDNVIPMLSKVLKQLPKLLLGLLENLGPQLLDTGLTAVRDLISGLAEQLPTLIPQITQMVLDFIDAILENIPLFVDAGVQLFIGLIDGFAEAIPIIIERLPEIIKNVIDAILQSIPLLVEAGIKLFTALVEDGPAIVYGILEIIPEIITGILESLVENFPAIIDAGIDLFSALVSDGWTIIKNITKFIGNVVDAIAKGFIECWPRMKQAGKDLFSKVPDRLSELNDLFHSKVVKIVDSISGWFKDQGSKLASAGKNLVSNLNTRWSELSSKFHNGVNTIVSNVSGWFSSQKNKISSAGKTMISKLTSGWGSFSGRFKNAAHNIVNNIAGGFRSKIHQFTSIGRDIVRGVWRGITGMYTWIKNKVSGFFSGIVNSVKNTLGIHSPSTVFEYEIGKQIPAGAAKGIFKYLGPLSKAKQALTDALMPSDELEFNTKLRASSVISPAQAYGNNQLRQTRFTQRPAIIKLVAGTREFAEVLINDINSLQDQEIRLAEAYR